MRKVALIGAASLGLMVLTMLSASRAEAATAGASNPAIAVDSQGLAAVAWMRRDGEAGAVQAVRLDGGGNPTAVATLAGFPRGSTPAPQTMFDSQDRAAVSWVSSAGLNLVPIEAEGSAGAVQTIPGVAGRLLVDSHGRMTVVRFDSEIEGKFIRAVQLDANGSPGPVRTLLSGNLDDWDATVDGDGHLTVVAASHLGVHTARLQADGTVDPARTITTDTSPAVAAIGDSAGRTTVVWSSLGGMRSLRFDAGGAPGPIQTLTPFVASGVWLAIDPQDRVTAVWNALGVDSVLQGIRLAADGTPGPVRSLSPPRARFGDMAVDPDGRTTLAWELEGGVQVVQLAADGAPGSVHALSPLAVDPAVAVDAEGRATVVWTRLYRPPPRGEVGIIQSVRLDATGAPGPVRDLSAGDASPPELSVGGSRPQRLKRSVRVRPDCDEWCDFTAAGTLVIKKRSSRQARPKAARFPLRTASGTNFGMHADFVISVRARLHLKVNRRARRAAVRALERDRKVAARISLTAVDYAGNVDTGAKRVRLRSALERR